MSVEYAPYAKAEMLVRRPVAEVFEAFVDPAVTSRFWFTRGSGRLEAGEQVQWDWEMYGVSAQIGAKAIEENRRILLEWPAEGAPTALEFLFTSRADDTTFVSITETGFSGSENEVLEQAVASTEAFTLVLAGAKALLEHDVVLDLVPDRFPDGIEGQ